MKQKLKWPLARLLRKDTPFVWGADQEQAFATLKQSLSEAPVLVRPDFDKNLRYKPTRRDYAIGAVLTQEREDGEHPVYYISRMERNTNEEQTAFVLPPLSGEQRKDLHRQSGRRWTSERGRRAPREKRQRGGKSQPRCGG
ncbi:unnamed protein product [Trichogramma brassicae]|uniref:Reverse transcriptase/retrotransposon-derived protein RNase H-like domain-containing protein n=1 Tax=Trichogramma brassicae TaxID=86971 RepID=A0A6H5IHN8_9HYME|nr:unnamed protein product [Trichogramma brassicae]